MKKSGPQVGYNQILASLSPDCKAFIEERSMTKPIVSGEVLHETDAPLHSLILPHSGLVSLQYTTEQGRTVEKMAVGADGAIGIEYLLGGSRLYSHAATVISGRATWVLVQDFLVASERFPCVRPAMSAYFNRKFQKLMQSVVCASIHTARERLCSWLLQADDMAQVSTFDITQRMLADILGLRLATVSDCCNKLLSSGAIHYSRGTLRIVDRAVLERQACECYGVIRDLESTC